MLFVYSYVASYSYTYIVNIARSSNNLLKIELEFQCNKFVDSCVASNFDFLKTDNWLKRLAISQNIRIVANKNTINHLITSFAAPPAFGLTIMIPPRNLLESTSNVVKESISKTTIIPDSYIAATTYTHFKSLVTCMRVLVKGKQANRSLENPCEPLKPSI